jgi:NIMA (never in mitosis gene a)-related kinase
MLSKRYHIEKFEISFIDSITRDKKAALNEVRLLASIECDYIVAFKSAFFEEDDQTLYIVMEYACTCCCNAEKGDLAQKI